jgi:hypothetical protein
MNNKQRNPAPKASVPVPEECAPQNEDLKIIYWPIEKFVHYARNPRKNDVAVDRMVSSLTCRFWLKSITF